MRKKNITSSIVGLLILFVIFVVPKHWKIILSVFCVALVCYLIVKFILQKKRKSHINNNNDATEKNPITEQTVTNYILKKSLITDGEKVYFETIKKIIEPQYVVQPQINLASIIDKNSTDRFRNELFRNVDFGIFDQSYKPLVLIEINDESHVTPERKERDKKVKAICTNAGIPVITFWTKFGVDEDYIKKRLSEHIALNSNNSEGSDKQENIPQTIKGE